MEKIPKGRLSRSLSSGRIAAKMGTNQLGYMIKKPFLSKDRQRLSRQIKDEKNAQVLFNGLSMLRGTALKAAQMLSFETELISETLRKELQKSYHQVPPINRALVRKIMTNNFLTPPENMFDTFNTKAFAAASLGQVHQATSQEKERLAVKLQYPDISKTISNDIKLLKTALRPMGHIIKIALDEIETILLNETDYEKEGQNIAFFRRHMKTDDILIPEYYSSLSTKQVLTMSFMEGRTLDEWLALNPDQESRNRIGQILHDIFIKGFYTLNRLHADPNPGNFLVTDDLKICLLDFGCVRKFDQNFIHLYQRLIQNGAKKDIQSYIELLEQMKFLTPGLDPEIKNQMVDLFMKFGNFFSALFKEESFDFSAHPGFMEKGRKIAQQMHGFRKHLHNILPEFLFLDRTRYGLIRLFEKMNATVCFRNRYEYCE